MVRRTAQCLIAGTLLLAGTAQAFGPRGHELVAQLATWYLNEDARALIARHYGDNYRSMFLEDANYAREVLAQRGNEWRLGFHYTWFEPGDSGFQMSEHCPDGLCSVGAVLASREVLLRTGTPRDRQLDALRFLVHYMADLHDPVNAGYSASKGGRTIILEDSDLTSHTLYEIWQEGLIDQLPYSPFVMANVWAREITDAQVSEWQSGEPQSWVWETHEAARDIAWPLAEEAGGWNAIYRRDAMPLLENRIKKAAVRLAWMLNQVGSVPRAPGNPLTGASESLLTYETEQPDPETAP